MTAIVITNCTTRKRADGVPIQLPKTQRPQAIGKVASKWASLVEQSPRITTAGDLYLGRAFSESKAIARSLRGELYVVSAGLGLLHESDSVPNYNLTVTTGEGSISELVGLNVQSSAQWWNELVPLLGPAKPLERLIRKSAHRIVLVALPSSYLWMVRDDLANVRQSDADKLRIFTSELGRVAVPPSLAHCVIPYDERLEGLPSFDGTRADFPQRALRHFVTIVQGHERDLEQGHRSVSRALAKLSVRSIPVREKKTDEQIVAILHKNWQSYGGSAGRLLRCLRDDKLVACEQSRFSNLWRTVRAEREGVGRKANATG